MNPAPPPSLAAQPTAPRTSKLAIAALVFGILSILGGAILIVPMLLAIIFGHIAVAATDKDRALGGKGLAVAGMVLGYCSIFFGGLLAAMAIPAFQKVRENAMRRTMYNDARQIGAAAYQSMLESGAKTVSFEVDPVSGKISGALAPYVKQITPGTRAVDGVVELENGSFSLQNPRFFGGAVQTFTSEGAPK